jgi:DNA invertase Pin-like site-specific DNA recombinase
VVAKVYADDDTRTYRGRPRPAWQQLISDVQMGAIDAVVGWHVDSLTRSPRELEGVVRLADNHGVALATVTGKVDLSDPAGRLVARMLGAAARYEAKHHAQGRQEQRRRAAEARVIAGWGTRPFGYADDRRTVVDTEAAIIRRCAARVLAGESLARVCCDLARSGIITPGGRWWLPTTLRQLLVSARISGRREHICPSNGPSMRPVVGKIVADSVCPAIVSSDDSDRLRALLDDSGCRNDNSANGRRDLFRAIVHCGPFCELCRHSMISRSRSGIPHSLHSNMPERHLCGYGATRKYQDLWRDSVKRLIAERVCQVVRRAVR